MSYYMDYVPVMRDSVETSVSLGLFKNKQESSFAHIFKSKQARIPLAAFEDVDNFSSERLCKSAEEAYPLCDRPRGDKDISSVKHCQKQIQQNKELPPIWVVQKGRKYILLDGAHRVVSHYCECKQCINAYVINITTTPGSPTKKVRARVISRRTKGTSRTRPRVIRSKVRSRTKYSTKAKTQQLYPLS